MPDFTDKIKGMQIQPTLLVEQVTKVLTDAILQGVFKGGDQLVEAELQKQFGISRSPIRETFRILEKHGLVVVHPRRGTFVKKVTRKDMEQHFPIRACLEGLAAKLSAERLTTEDIREMSESLSEMQKAISKQDRQCYMRHHGRFHEIFISSSGNDALIDILTDLRQHEVWFRLTYFYMGSRPDSVEIHQAILDALAAGDGNKAEELVRDHIMDSSSGFLNSLSNGENSQPGADAPENARRTA